MMRRSVLALVGAVGALAVGASSASAVTLYMSPTGTDTGGCRSEATACLTFGYTQGQIGAVPGPHTVFLAAGDYAGGFMISVPGIAWKGPQAGVPAPGRTGPEARILVPADGYGLSTIAATTSFDGLTFESADATPGHYGISASAATIVSNVRVIGVVTALDVLQGSTISNSDLDTTGDAIFASGTTTVTNTTIRAGADSPYRGINQAGGSLVATGNTFLRGFGGVRANATTAVINRNRFSSNVGFGLDAAAPNVDARNNWWGCNEGPTDFNCSIADGDEIASAQITPYLKLTGEVVPDVVPPGHDTEVRATLNVNSAGVDVGPVLAGQRFAFLTPGGGTFPSAFAAAGADGIARNTLTVPEAAGPLTVNLSLDNALTPLSLDVVPDLQTDPSSKSFGTVFVGTTSPVQAFTVTNTTAASIRIKAVSVLGDNPGDFVVWANGCRTTLAPGATCPVSAAFRPTNDGPKNAAISLIADGHDPGEIALTGTATNNLALDPVPAYHEFGAVSVGARSAYKTITVTNRAATPVQITAVSIGGSTADFTVAAGACRNQTLASGASCAISTSFMPQSTGPKGLNMQIHTVGRGISYVDLAGDAVGPALTINPESGDFGTVAVGSSTRQLFTITNNGATSAPVSIGTVTLGGADASAFTLYAGGCRNQTLAVGASCEISAFLRSVTPGSKTARISVAATGQAASTIDLMGDVSPS